MAGICVLVCSAAALICSLLAIKQQAVYAELAKDIEDERDDLEAIVVEGVEHVEVRQTGVES